MRCALKAFLQPGVRRLRVSVRFVGDLCKRCLQRPLRFRAESFGRVATCGEEGCSQAFLQPGVRRAVLGGCVCEMRFLQASAAQQGCWCICTAAGWFLGRREARGDRFLQG